MVHGEANDGAVGDNSQDGHKSEDRLPRADILSSNRDRAPLVVVLHVKSLNSQLYVAIEHVEDACDREGGDEEGHEAELDHGSVPMKYLPELARARLSHPR